MMKKRMRKTTKNNLYARVSKLPTTPSNFFIVLILAVGAILGASSFAPFAKGGDSFLVSSIPSLAPPLVLAQEPGQPPPPEPPTPSSSSKYPKQKYSHANDFLIRGTVFTDKALSFPGAQLRIRRTSEKKFRWQDYTNSRGEFAIRVPQGAEYELVVHAKGFTDQAKTIDAKKGLTEERLVFRMEPQGGKK